jgi:hypothetical protein
VRRWLPTLLLLLAMAFPALASGPPRLSIQAPSPQLAAHIRQVVAHTAVRLEAWTGASPQSLRIEVVAGRDDFERRSAQLGGPRWAAGVALPRHGLILLRAPRQLGGPAQFETVLVHEMMHLYLAAGLKGRHAPLWLEEGLAMQLSGEGGWGLAATMTRAVLGPGLLPLSELETSFPPQAGNAALAYAQSYYLVGWLLDHYGEESLRRLVLSLSQGRPLTAALHRATGLSLVGIQERFDQDMNSRFSWLSALTAGGALWALVALVAGVGLVVRRRRQRASVAMMDGKRGSEAALRPRRRPGRDKDEVLREAGMDKSGPGQGTGSPRDT